jgi:CO/xanthine dehydrogenase Mo-binding subunit
MRRENCVAPNTETCNGLRVTSVGIQACIDAVVAASGYAERRGKLGPGRGLGIATSAYMCGALHPIYQNEMPHSTVQIKIDRSGEVVVYSGTADVGQGSNHMLAGLVASRLGLYPHDVRVVEGDTSLTPVDLGSYSSRVTFMAGNAALTAVAPLRARIVDAVAAKLGCAPEEVTFGRPGSAERGDGPRVGTDRSDVSWVDAVWLAEERSGPLVFAGGYTPPKIGSRFRRQSVGPSPAYSFTAQVAEVEVDEETGEVRVARIWVAHDCGRVLNLAVVEGQIEGCVYMGVGEALGEEQRYLPGGLLRAPSLLEYKLPTVHECPEVEVFAIESHDPEGPLGAKEAGEGPQLSTVPAIANAIHDACGVWLHNPPFTPERVLRAIDTRRARGGA